MKATISIKGYLTITAESEVEAFALKSWCSTQKESDYRVVVDLGNWSGQGIKSKRPQPPLGKIYRENDARKNLSDLRNKEYV